jgi:hypothetical protein
MWISRPDFSIKTTLYSYPQLIQFSVRVSPSKIIFNSQLIHRIGCIIETYRKQGADGETRERVNMINKQTLIDLINQESFVYIVELEIFATRAQAKRKASVLNYYADKMNKARVTIEKQKAHLFSDTI